MTKSASESDQVLVEPTKDFFVYIVTRDIDISDAVIDLIDNSIDGAKRLRPKQGDDYEGLKIAIEFDGNSFSIEDNCGGIPVELAREYAFRFGRAKDMPPTPGSVGQFGIGMKRALFKFGRNFEVDSKTTSDSFRLVVDVAAWLKNTKNWNFSLTDVGTGTAIKKAGTRIIVNSLNTEAKSAFSDTATFNKIVSEIQTRQQYFIERGLKIAVNGTEVRGGLFQILRSAKIKPAKWEQTFKDVSEPQGSLKYDVTVRIFAGLGRSSPGDAGWYVICNGRVVLEADKSTVTGWGPSLPHYHNQYARFRGYVFFESDSAGVLPWTTTKADVDENNSVFRKAREQMAELAFPVIRFLDAVDKENDLPAQERVLNRALSKAESVGLNDEIGVSAFEGPSPTPSKSNELQTVSFKRPKVRIAELMSIYNAAKPSEVGERAFDEAYSRYIEE